MSLQDKKNYILRELKKGGCRITSQRQVLIDVILRDECCSCKEIYYQAIKEDPTLGLATVYRMVKTMEEAGMPTYNILVDTVNEFVRTLEGGAGECQS